VQQLLDQVIGLEFQVAACEAALAAQNVNSARAPYPYTRWDRLIGPVFSVANSFKAIDIATDLISIPMAFNNAPWVTYLVTDAATSTTVIFILPPNFWPVNCTIEITIAYLMTFANGITAQACAFATNIFPPDTTANVTPILVNLPADYASGQNAYPYDDVCLTNVTYRFSISPSAAPTGISFLFNPLTAGGFLGQPSAVSVGALELKMITSDTFTP